MSSITLKDKVCDTPQGDLKAELSLKKVVTYLQCSDVEKKQRIIKYCEENNLKLLHMFEEENDCLKKLAPERPGLCALIEFLRYNVHDTVLVDNYTDLVTSKVELEWLTRKLQQNGKALKIIDETGFNGLNNETLVDIPSLEDVYKSTKETLENNTGDCFFKGYPDQYTISIGRSPCSLRCRSCYEVLMPANMKRQEMSFDIFKRAVDCIPNEYNDIIVALCPAGETLTFKNLVPMVQYITDKKPNVISCLPTNGIPLNEEMSKKLIEAGLSNIMISLNAYDREDYKWFTGYDCYDTVERNIHKFMEIRERLESKTPLVRVQIFGIKRFESKIDAFVSKWEKIVDVAEVTPVSYCSHIPNLENIDRFKKKGDYPVIKTCNFLFRNIMIYPDGTLFPCCINTPVMTGSVPFSLGNIRDINPFELWNSETYLRLREKNLNGQPIMKECLECNRIVSGDWVVAESFEADLFRKSKFKRLLGME